MDPKERIENSLDVGKGTLGDVLRAYTAETRAAEAEWVALVRTVAARDQRALRALYQRTYRIVFTLSFRIVGNPETAEEVTLDVFHDVWRRAPHYDPAAGTVVGWILNQTRSRAIDRLRYEQREKRAGPALGQPASAVAAREPHDDLEIRDRGRLLREALTRLTADERQAVETAFFSELTYAETATRLSQPIGTVKTRVRSALEKLRQALERRVSDL